MKSPQKQHFINILERYRLGTATPEEVNFLESYYNVFELNEELINSENEQDFNDLKEQIRAKVEKRIQPGSRSFIFSSWFRYTVAASLVIMISFGGYFFYKPAPIGNDQTSAILPGSNKAILTLPGGRKIVLDDVAKGEIQELPGVSISKTENGELVYQVTENAAESGNSNALHTISTPKGGQYQVILPDGTHVWLNAATSLSYPASFKGSSRTVSLNGEAYFEVAKNKEMPFLIKTSAQTVEVLGTHFNVNAYPNEQQIRTTLLEGAVKISAGNSQRILNPGQQALVSNAHPEKIEVQQVDVSKEIAWKNGVFAFEADDLQTVMRQIERWYNVDVTYTGKPCEEKFYGEISRNDKLSDVFKILEVNNVHFDIKGRVINVTCNP